MPNLIGRNLHLCFTKMKCPLQLEPPPTNPIVKNYNSLYDHHYNFESSSDPKSRNASPTSTACSSSSAEPDLSSVFASQRFFFSSPGLSNSITEYAAQSSTTQSSNTIKYSNSLDLDDPSRGNTNNTSSNDQTASFLAAADENHSSNPCSSWSSSNVVEVKVKDSVAVSTYSPDPYMDFRRSMQEMVEARDLVDVNANWEYLHQLLSSYLALNPKSTHKFIIGAFADLLVSLLSSSTTFSPEINGGEGRGIDEYGPGGCEISRHCM